MRSFTLPLVKNYNRSVVWLEKFHGLYTMLDTGAVYPVWIYTEEYLRGLGGRQIKSDVEFSGFGGKTSGNLYEIPIFQLGELIYPNFHILASRSKLPCHMLLSATMFDGLIYEVNTKQHTLTITMPDDESNIRNLRIYDRDGSLHISVTGDEK